jgi:hydroxymethylbilane synthase
VRLTLGTRGSRLALAQGELVAGRLRRAAPGVEVELAVISTEGDRVQAGPLPSWGHGVFVRDLEHALLDGRIDLAVHSLKDVPAALPDGLALVAVPPRADPGDVLVTRDGRSLDALPRGARAGTSSLRRAAFLLAHRADLRVVPVRGNVDTRWRKLLDPDTGLDALVLAAAGLDRLGLAGAPRAPIPYDVLLPAPGQGALALEARAGDERVASLAAHVDDPATAAAVRAERRILADLEGGCRLPVAALAQPLRGGRLSLAAAVAAPDGSRSVRFEATGALDDPDALGAAVAAELRARGAGDLLREATVASAAVSAAGARAAGSAALGAPQEAGV